MALGKVKKKERNRRRQLKKIKVWHASLEGVVYHECSRFAGHHRHAFRWSARLCGLFQYWYHRLTGAPFYYNPKKK